MNPRRSIEDLPLEELERLVLLRRREERLRKLHERGIIAEVPEVSLEALPPPRSPDEDLAFLEKPARRRSIAGSSGAKRSVWGQLLLLVEIVGVAGLIVAVLLFVADLRRLNAAARDLQAVPPPIEVPAKEAPVLPGGSLPPSTTAIPAIYQDWIEPSADAAAVPLGDTSGEEYPARIVIPRIGVDAPVVPGDDWEALKKGAGHHLGSALPGERGNMVISAHNDIFGEIFRDLNKLEEGDEVIVYDGAGRSYHYLVASERIVEPTEVSVLEPTTEPVVTLITCHPYLIDTQRLIVVAQLRGS